MSKPRRSGWHVHRIHQPGPLPTADQRYAAQSMLLPVPGQTGDAVLSGILADAVATALGRSFRPKHVVFVADLLKTQSMKVMRRKVRAALAGQRLGDLSSLANPQALLICAVNGEGGQA